MSDKFNEYFVNVGPSLSYEIPESDISYRSDLHEITTTLDENPHTENEFNKTFNSLKINKAPGSDELRVNVTKSVYNFIKEPPMKIFNESIISWDFSL